MVIEVDVLEGVDVEVHPVVGTEPVMVDAEHCHLRQDVVY